MILVDAGPLVALFDPRDGAHAGCKALVKRLRDELLTTVPVLTEVSHLLRPSSIGFRRLAEMVSGGDLGVAFLSPTTLSRAFELIAEYADQEMDLADASLVATAEALATTRILTLDRRDFSIYRVRRGRRLLPFEIVR